MTEPWDFTEAQRMQFREAHAEAKGARLRQCAEAAGCPHPVVWRWYPYGRNGEPAYLCDEHAADKDLSDLWDLLDPEGA